MNYWKDHFNKNVQIYQNSLKKQVDMTLNKQELDDEQVKLRVESIIKNLELELSDTLLDLCCGNGILTRQISEKVGFIYAVDFSSELLNIAKKVNQKDNIKYQEGDVVTLNFKEFKVSKVLIYSCLQYLQEEQVSKLFYGLSTFQHILVYISNIPDRSKLLKYYDTKEKLEYYKKTLDEGKPHIGTWYLKNYLADLAKSNGFNYKFLTIDRRMNTSYYRFDLLLEK